MSQPTAGILELSDTNMVLDPLRTTTVHKSCLFTKDGIHLPAAGRASNFSCHLGSAQSLGNPSSSLYQGDAKEKAKEISTNNTLPKDFFCFNTSLWRSKREIISDFPFVDAPS